MLIYTKKYLENFKLKKEKIEVQSIHRFNAHFHSFYHKFEKKLSSLTKENFYKREDIYINGNIAV